MSKSFEKILSQKPNFIASGEPVSGSTDPLNQDVVVLQDGTLINTVEGVNNRVPSHLWGIIKLLVDILKSGHDEFGQHSISGDDIAADASIPEAKLLLDLNGETRPDGLGNYATTQDIVDVINALWPIRNIATSTSYFTNVNQNNIVNLIDLHYPNFFNSYVNFPSLGGWSGECVIADNDKIVVNSYEIILNGVESSTSACRIDLGKPDGLTGVPSSVSKSLVVALEVWDHNISTTGVGFPYGNVSFRNKSRPAGTDNLTYAHTSEFVVADDSETFTTFLKDSKNNVFLNYAINFVQKAYTINVRSIDYSNYKFGLDDPNYKTYNGDKAITPSKEYKGCWESIDKQVLVIPLMLVVRRNAGIYHEFINPGGQALKRSTAPNLISFSDCFALQHVAYYNAQGVECPAYNSATYNSTDDVYVYNDDTYYRSGTRASTKSASYIPGGSFIEDVLPEYDMISLKKDVVSSVEGISTLEQMVLKGQFQHFDFNSLIHGTASNRIKSDFYSLKAPQTIGFGTSESSLFGAANKAALYIDSSNNGSTAFTDSCRRSWTDREASSYVSFTFTQGNPNSESRDILTYDPTSRILAIDTTALSSDPVASSDLIPIMTWANGDEVLLSESWTGLGTTSASCILNLNDHSNHVGMRVYGLIKLDYAKGSGVPFILKNILSIRSKAGMEYKYLDRYKFSEYTQYVYSGRVGDGATLNTLPLKDFAHKTNGYYAGLHLTVLKNGQKSRIASYNGLTKVVTLETNLGVKLEEDDVVNIHYLETNDAPRLFVDSLSRGIDGNIKRSRMQANANGVVLVNNHIYTATTGSAGSTPIIRGSILKGLASNEYVDVLHETDDPFNTEFMIKFVNTQPNNMYRLIDQSDNFKIKKIGNLFSTTIGSANKPWNAYRGFIPTSTLPANSDVNWIGGDGASVTTFTDLKNISWAQVIPFEGMTIRGSDMSVAFRYFDDEAYLVSLTQTVDKNTGCHIGFMLAKSENTKRDMLLIAVNYSGNFGFDTSSNVYQLEVNKTFLIKN